jgi:anti-anti-sigma regulatory factor
MGNILRNSNIITVEGDYSDANLHYFLATIHKAVEEFGYQDLILDFSRCSTAFPSSMLGTCAQIMHRRTTGVGFKLVLPENQKLARLFHNANWAFLLEPENHPQSKFHGYTQVAATQYLDPEEQHSAVNRIVNAILGAIPDMERSSFAAFEWAINEITDNVLTHAKSSIGGIVQVSTFKKMKKLVQFLVADAGESIPKTLRTTHTDLTSDLDALDVAIREGVTRDKAIGQGNGLFGSYQICSHCKGSFQIESGHAKLTYSDKSGLHIRNERIPYDGTLVIASIDFSRPDLLDEALQFGGERYAPVDYVETNYEAEDCEKLLFVMKNESKSFGTRPAGTPIRNRLNNLYKMSNGQKIFIDFNDIPIVSSSFADEVFGKLFVEIGPLGFMQSFEFLNISQTVRQLIDKAIAQRIAVTHGNA